MKPVLVFDVDGTLVDSQATIIEAMRLSYVAHDVAFFDPQKIRTIVGLSVDAAVSQLLPNETEVVQKYVAQSFTENYRILLATGERERMFPGIRDLLVKLDHHECHLAIATGNSRRGLDRILDEHDLDTFFISRQTADTHPSKPHPSMLRRIRDELGLEKAPMLMIGDTSFDMTMALNADVDAIGVSWGYHEVDVLSGAGARAIAQDAQHLLDLVEKWAGLL